MIFIFLFNHQKVYDTVVIMTNVSVVDDMVTYVDVSAPRFKFRATVRILYMEKVQLLNLKDILKNFPNLRYLTLMNMEYFNCNWLENLPEHIHLRSNMCYSTRGHIESLELSTVRQSFSEIYNHISTQIDEYQNSSTKIVPSAEMTTENAIKIKVFTTASDVEEKEMKSDFGKRKQDKFYWWIISFVLFIIIIIIMSIISVYIYKRRRRRHRGQDQITDTDTTMLPLSQHLMEESSM